MPSFTRQGFSVTPIDKFGNTILHLAISKGHYQLAEKVIGRTKMEINYRNYEGHTALDILNQAQSTLEVQHLKDQMKKAGCKTDVELLQTTVIESPRDALERKFEQLLETVRPQNEHAGPLDLVVYNDPTEQLPRLKIKSHSRANAHHHQGVSEPEVQDNNVSEPESLSSRSSLTITSKRKCESLKCRKELIEIYN